MNLNLAILEPSRNGDLRTSIGLAVLVQTLRAAGFAPYWATPAQAAASDVCLISLSSPLAIDSFTRSVRKHWRHRKCVAIVGGSSERMLDDRRPIPPRTRRIVTAMDGCSPRLRRIFGKPYSDVCKLYNVGNFPTETEDDRPTSAALAFHAKGMRRIAGRSQQTKMAG